MQAKKGVNAASQAASDVADSAKATASDAYNAAQKHGGANAKTAQQGVNQVWTHPHNLYRTPLESFLKQDLARQRHCKPCSKDTWPGNATMVIILQ